MGDPIITRGPPTAADVGRNSEPAPVAAVVDVPALTRRGRRRQRKKSARFSVPAATLRKVCPHVLDKSRPAALNVPSEALCAECCAMGAGRDLLYAGFGLAAVALAGWLSSPSRKKDGDNPGLSLF